MSSSDKQKQHEDPRKPSSVPGQTQNVQPGLEHKMNPEPKYMAPNYKGCGKLKNKVALITGGDSGIGRSISILFAREGAHVAIIYLDHEQKDAQLTQQLIHNEGTQSLLLPGDISNSEFCSEAVEKTISKFGHLDILVNNAAQQYVQDSIEQISDEQLERTFKVNIFSFFYMARSVIPHMKKQKGGCIINTGSVTAYKGKEKLLDYSSTKGAIEVFTYSLANQVAEFGIRVNGVAPGPIWTPLIPASFSKEEVEEFGKNTLLGRPGQPEEVAPCYVFLASEADSSYMTGQFLHPNGGTIVHG